jgi:hypothetical protein
MLAATCCCVLNTDTRQFASDLACLSSSTCRSTDETSYGVCIHPTACGGLGATGGSCAAPVEAFSHKLGAGGRSAARKSQR